MDGRRIDLRLDGGAWGDAERGEISRHEAGFQAAAAIERDARQDALRGDAENAGGEAVDRTGRPGGGPEAHRLGADADEDGSPLPG